MNKIGLHTGYWGGLPIADDLDGLITLYAELGIDILEVSVAMFRGRSDEEIQEYRKKIDDAGLTLVFNGGINARLDLADDDREVRAAGVEACKRLLEIVSKAGSKIFTGVNYSVWKRLPSRPIDEAEKQRVLELSLDSMSKIMPVAEDYGVAYAFELVNRYEQFLLNTVDEGLAFCSALGSPAAMLQLDTFHMNIDERDMFEAMRKAQSAGKFAHLHVGEPDRSCPGLSSSHMNWKKLVQTLDECGYQGDMTIEPFTRMETLRNFQGCVWRQLGSADLEGRIEEAKKSVAFLRGLKA